MNAGENTLLVQGSVALTDFKTRIQANGCPDYVPFACDPSGSAANYQPVFGTYQFMNIITTGAVACDYITVFTFKSTMAPIVCPMVMYTIPIEY